MSQDVGRLIPWISAAIYVRRLRSDCLMHLHATSVKYPLGTDGSLWHTQKYISRVDETGKVNIWLIGTDRSG